jgi:hypothetical protein
MKVMKDLWDKLRQLLEDLAEQLGGSGGKVGAAG